MEGSAFHPSTGCNLFAQGQSEPPQALEQDQHSCSAIVLTLLQRLFGFFTGKKHIYAKFMIIKQPIFKRTFFYFNKGQRGLPFLYKFQNKDFGKTVFLTKEEAEKALKEREQ